MPHHKKTTRKFIDLTGKILNKWKVLELDNKVTGQKTWKEKYWKCECLCGNKEIVAGRNLRDGRSKACKQCRKEYRKLHKDTITSNCMVNQKFGSLTIIKDAEYEENKTKPYRFVTCICDCNDKIEKIFRLKCIIDGHAKSCGCAYYKDTDNSKNKRVSYLDKAGYVMVYAPDHDNANYHGYVREHTFVMSCHLGRAIQTNQETVHHKNGIKTDNRLENLELWNNSHSSGQRVSDMIKFCEEYLVKYKALYDAGKIS